MVVFIIVAGYAAAVVVFALPEIDKSIQQLEEKNAKRERCPMLTFRFLGLVPIRESYGWDVSEPSGELTKHPILGLLELYKRTVELLTNR
jgi:hypothetical protein